MNQSDRLEVEKMITASRKGFPAWAKESLAFCIVMGGAAFFVNSYIPEKIGNQTRGMGEDISSLRSSMSTVQHDVTEIKGEIKDTLNKALNRALDNVQSRPQSTKGSRDRSSADFALGASALKLASSLDLPIDPPIWTKTLKVLNVRSILNASFSPIPPHSILKPGGLQAFEFNLTFINPPPEGINVGADVHGVIWTVGDDVSIDQAARFETIGSRVNTRHKYGPRIIVVDLSAAIKGWQRNAPLYIPATNGIKLDEKWLKNVVIRNTRVAYFHGPMRLENVIFINCTFELNDLPAARYLAQEMFDSPSVSLYSLD